jgi:hypothetical protein
VATLNTLRAPYTARDHRAAVTKFTRQIPGIAALVDAWWLGVEHQITLLALDPPTQSWLPQRLLPVVYWQTQVEKTKTPALKAAYQKAFQQAQTALLQHPLTATVTPPEFETYYAPGPAAWPGHSSAPPRPSRAAMALCHHRIMAPEARRPNA